MHWAMSPRLSRLLLGGLFQLFLSGLKIKCNRLQNPCLVDVPGWAKALSRLHGEDAFFNPSPPHENMGTLHGAFRLPPFWRQMDHLCTSPENSIHLWRVVEKVAVGRKDHVAAIGHKFGYPVNVRLSCLFGANDGIQHPAVTQCNLADCPDNRLSDVFVRPNSQLANSSSKRTAFST